MTFTFGKKIIYIPFTQ